MIQDLQERGFPCAIPLWSWRGAGSEPVRIEQISRLRRRFNLQRSDGVVYAEVDKGFAASSFERYGSWLSDIWAFLVCQRPLANWAEQVHRVSRKGRVTKELMAQIELFMSNRWEHGFELLSHSFSHEELLEMAKDACSKLDWQMETRTS